MGSTSLRAIECEDIWSRSNILLRLLKHTDTARLPTETLLLIFENTVDKTESALENWRLKISGGAEANIAYLTHLRKSALTNQLIDIALYLQFKHVPLYLEWAPLGVFSGKPEEKLAEETSETTKENKVYNVTAFAWVCTSIMQCMLPISIDL